MTVVRVLPSSLSSNHPPTGSEIAWVDLCKIGGGELARLIAKYRSLESFGRLWDFDGSTTIALDTYESAIVRVPIVEVIQALDVEYRRDGYRRFRIALAMLTTLLETFTETAGEDDEPGAELFCYFYGH